jgi:hypothetical protein
MAAMAAADFAIKEQSEQILDDKNMVINGLFFPGGLDQYLSYYQFLRYYEDLSSKDGYLIPLDILHKFQKCFSYMCISQINFVLKCMPIHLYKQIYGLWSFIYVVRHALFAIQYPENIKHRLRESVYVFEIYHDIITKIQHFGNSNYNEPDLNDYIKGFKLEDFSE